ncbi:MAG: UDP-N-acetylglucosamine 1-carboxyvinyltransferase [Actinomycetota bacterium]|nr:UDP-N-acetylglucosamine 1-carboxyvinyltransferase [Actinomycetota bacterium]
MIAPCPAPHADEIIVRPSGPLRGRVLVPGAKNSVLKLMAATILGDGVYEFTNVPDIVDVSIMAGLLAEIGVRTERPEHGRLVMENRGDLIPVAPYEHVERIRASINVLGPLLTRCGRVRLSMPGGDDFGSRPIDLHVAGLEAMGATFKFGHGDVEAFADRLHGAHINFPFPSVGATENLVCAAVCADGETIIENAAREPEITDLCQLLIAMGAEIEGVGTSLLRISGVEPGSMRAAAHRTVPDRVQSATYLAALGVSGGRIEIVDARPGHMVNLLDAFVEMGMRVDATPTGLVASSEGRLRSVDVQTLPYPGIATDYKPLVITLLTVAASVGIVTENLYPGRFRYVEELQRLGADIRTAGHHAVVRGVPRLSGAPVRAHDIRAGAAMVVAGLAAEGETRISGVHHIDRGYEDLVGRLQGVGATIERRNETAAMPVE